MYNIADNIWRGGRVLILLIDVGLKVVILFVQSFLSQCQCFFSYHLKIGFIEAEMHSSYNGSLSVSPYEEHRKDSVRIVNDNIREAVRKKTADFVDMS